MLKYFPASALMSASTVRCTVILISGTTSTGVTCTLVLVLKLDMSEISHHTHTQRVIMTITHL